MEGEMESTDIADVKKCEDDDEPMEADSDGGSSDSSDSDDTGNDELYAELESQVTSNEYAYDPHVQLIKFLRGKGELEKLRAARKRMSGIFPLTEELWLAWLQDEIPLVSSDEERDVLTELFDKAVQDYQSVAIWLEYVQFSIGGMGQTEGISKIRKVFERAITAVGLHVTKGVNIWEAYREFETAILAGLQPAPGAISTKEQEDLINTQTNRITAILKRQLNIPLMDMEETYEEYKQWISEDVESQTKHGYEKALDKLQHLRKYEDDLLSADPPRLAEYKAYIGYEKSKGDPARLQCMYERALQENALNQELWLEYTKCLDELKISGLIIPAYERSVRNCPWAVDLWIRYTKAKERLELPSDDVKEIFTRALHAGFTQSTEFLQLWTAYCDYLRRRIRWTDDHEAELKDLRDTFTEAVNHLFHYFGKDGDPECTLHQYWARIEAKCCKNMEKVRELWNEIMQSGHGNKAQMWLQYYSLERVYGDHRHCRKILQRALNSASDFPETVCEAYINFEREDGSLQDLDTAIVRCEAQMKRVNERRAKLAEKEAEQAEQTKKLRAEKKASKRMETQQQRKQQHQQRSHKPQTQRPAATKEPTDTETNITVYQRKRKLEEEEPAEIDPEGFKVPLPPSPTQKTSSQLSPGKSPKSEAPPEFKPKSEPPPGFKPKSEPPPGFKPKSEPPPGFKPKSEPPPGFKPKEAQSASECAEPQSKKIKVDEDAADQTERHKPDIGKENRTVFISNLNYNLEEDRLRETFSKVGQINEIRLVRNFKGQSKGYAYIEFIDELPVMEALKLDRTPVDGRPMYVSKCEEKSQRGHQFKFSTEMEKSKLFIKGLPFTCTKEALETLFSEHGKLKDVRLVTYRSGAPKGLAFVEFEDEQDAAQAVLKTDGLVMGEHTISVAISNPPTRKTPLNQRAIDTSFTPSLGGGKKQTTTRGRASTQLSMMPRALNRAKPNTEAPPQNGSQDPTPATTPMSNQDFRNMLLKK